MLSKTSELAIQALVYISLKGSNQGYISPSQISDAIDASPTYTAKVTALLVRSGILKAQRGAKGGVALGRPEQSISLLEIVESCQGKILGDYCTPHDDLDVVCSYHKAMHELNQAITEVLKRWTLSDLLKKTCPHKSIFDSVACKMKWSAEI